MHVHKYSAKQAWNSSSFLEFLLKALPFPFLKCLLLKFPQIWYKINLMELNASSWVPFTCKRAFFPAPEYPLFIQSCKTLSRDNWAEYVLQTGQNAAGMFCWVELKFLLHFSVELKFCDASHSKCNTCMKLCTIEIFVWYSVNFYLGEILQFKKGRKKIKELLR